MSSKHRGMAMALFGVGIVCQLLAIPAEPATSLNVAAMPAIGEVDPRFQAYNVEMLEVTGGRFWKPYKDVGSGSKTASNAQQSASTPAGMNPDMYQFRPPIHLDNARLRKLAAALGPAYVRVSGTWANTSYFSGAGSASTTPPAGFNGVLTREQWKGVIDFAHAANAEIITSFAISPGTRNPQGLWTSEQALAFLSYTKAAGGRIAAAEFMNEPNFTSIGGAPKGYDANAYARDVAVFRHFLKQVSPGTLFLGPGSAAEGGTLSSSALIPGRLRSEDLLQATGPVYDVFSYHLYPAASRRCAGDDPTVGVAEAAALSEQWLSRPDAIHVFYANLAKRFEPGKPIWVTETADAACGGNPWASTFLDTFRYVDEHARLAQQGVRVVAHNTLAASDYGLLDENTFAPRPNYWAALLWNRLMGTTVLKPVSQQTPGLHVYAHCLKGIPGGVALLALNTDRKNSQTLLVSASSERYTMTAPDLEGTRVDLNGEQLQLGSNDALPRITGVPTASGQISLAPASVTFLAIREARNASCQ